MSTTAFRIKKFQEKHTNAELRKSENEWHWVRFPTSLDSLTLRKLFGNRRGLAAFGLYCVLVEISANGKPRGTLTTERGPMTVDDLAAKSGISKALIRDGLKILQDPSIGWVDTISIELNGNENPDSFGHTNYNSLLLTPNSNSSDAREKKSEDSEPDPPSKPRRSRSVHGNNVCTKSQAEEIYEHYPRKVGRAAAVKAITKAAHSLLDDDRHEEPLAFLMDRVTAYARSPAGQPPPAGCNDYRPHPATWFNSARFDDDPAEWEKPNGIDRPNNRTDTNISRVAAKPGKYAHIGKSA